MMTETLAEKRCRFTTMIGKLIEFANGLGFGVALDQVKRTQLEADANAASGRGIPNSLHLYGLAADINLYRGAMWLGTSADHLPLGTYWESLAPDARWGGRFSKPDGNHYSLEHNGVK
jgi:hypothetical protein